MTSSTSSLPSSSFLASLALADISSDDLGDFQPSPEEFLSGGKYKILNKQKIQLDFNFSTHSETQAVEFPCRFLCPPEILQHLVDSAFSGENEEKILHMENSREENEKPGKIGNFPLFPSSRESSSVKFSFPVIVSDEFSRLQEIPVSLEIPQALQRFLTGKARGGGKIKEKPKRENHPIPVQLRNSPAGKREIDQENDEKPGRMKIAHPPAKRRRRIEIPPEDEEENSEQEEEKSAPRNTKLRYLVSSEHSRYRLEMFGDVRLIFETRGEGRLFVIINDMGKLFLNYRGQNNVPEDSDAHPYGPFRNLMNSPEKRKYNHKEISMRRFSPGPGKISFTLQLGTSKPLMVIYSLASIIEYLNDIEREIRQFPDRKRSSIWNSIEFFHCEDLKNFKQAILTRWKAMEKENQQKISRT